jgi:hypothetical protein
MDRRKQSCARYSFTLSTKQPYSPIWGPSTGNSNIRNPILLSFIAKGLLPYRGLGSGIKRALREWKKIDFHNNQDDPDLKNGHKYG